MSPFDRPGLTLARTLQARAACEGAADAERFTVDRWGAKSMEAAIVRAAVGGTGRTDLASLDGTLAAEREFIEAAQALTVLGRLQGVRMVAPDKPYLPVDVNTSAAFVAEGRAIPVSRLSLAPNRIAPLRVGAIVVGTREAMQAEGADELLRVDMLTAVAKAADAALLAYNFVGDSATPAGIGYGWTEIPSTGDPALDFAAAVSAYAGQMRSATLVMSATTAVTFGLALRATGVGADVGAQGGQVCGIRVVTTDAEVLDSEGACIHMIDAAGIVMTDAGSVITLSQAGTIEMTDGADGNVLDPAGSSQAASVSLFAADAVAIRIIRGLNWKAARAGVVITGVSYSASA